MNKKLNIRLMFFLPGAIALHSGDIQNPLLPTNLQNLSGAEFFDSLLSALVTLGLTVGAIVFLFMAISGAIDWITAGGDRAKLETARGKVGNALVGLFVMLSIFGIISLIETIFGVSILLLDIGSLNL